MSVSEWFSWKTGCVRKFLPRPSPGRADAAAAGAAAPNSAAIAARSASSDVSSKETPT